MLKKRIIPTLLYKEFGLVKGKHFNNSRRVGPVLPAINIYNAREVDELICLDIAASLNYEDPDYQLVNDISKFCFVPLTIGGGINNVDQVQRLLEVGADKVAINSAAYNDKNLIENIANLYGSQCVVGSIDYFEAEGKYKCYSHSGSIETNEEVINWAKTLENMGAGELIITSINREGTMSGYDLDLLKQLTSSVNIPIIASGGAGEYIDMFKAISDAKVSAVAAGTIFHFTQKTPAEAKLFLDSHGIEIRRNNSFGDI